jgi:hypothetical protein
MDYYQPKISHAILSGLISVAMFAANGEWGIGACVVGGFIFMGITGCVLWMMVDGNNYMVTIRYIEAFINLTPEQRQVLAYQLPNVVRWKMHRGQLVGFFDDTNVPKDLFREFVICSNKTTTPSRRDWNTKEHPRWAWDACYKYFLDRGKVGRFSTGPESFPWMEKGYHDKLLFYWATWEGEQWNDQGALANERIFASDDELVVDGE